MSNDSHIRARLITCLSICLPFVIAKQETHLLCCAPDGRCDDAMIKHLSGLAAAPMLRAQKSVTALKPVISCVSDAGDDAPAVSDNVNEILNLLFSILHELPLEPALIFAAYDADAAAAFAAPRFGFDALVSAPQTSPQPECIAQASLPLQGGSARLCLYGGQPGVRHSAALIVGKPEGSQDSVLLRLHSECFTGDIFGSRRCDCGGQLHYALDRMMRCGEGVILYLPQEGRGIGLAAKLNAYHLQDTQGLDTVEANAALGFRADNRDFSFAIGILQQLQISNVRLLTNNPAKVKALEHAGITVSEQIAVDCRHDGNRAYLDTKRDKLHHQIPK